MIGRPGREDGQITRYGTGGSFRMFEVASSRQRERTHARRKRATARLLAEAMEYVLSDGVGRSPGRHGGVSAAGEEADEREDRGTRNDATGVRHLFQCWTDELCRSAPIFHLSPKERVCIALGRESERRGETRLARGRSTHAAEQREAHGFLHDHLGGHQHSAWSASRDCSALGTI